MVCPVIRGALVVVVLAAAARSTRAASLDVAGEGGYQLSSTTGSTYDKQGVFTGGITGDAMSKTVTFGGNDTYSRPLGAVYGNHTFDYSATMFGQGTATFGSLSGAISFDAQAKPESQAASLPGFDPILNLGHASLSAHMQLTFSDSGIVTSPTLPVGSPVTLHFTVASQAYSIYVGRPQTLDMNGGINKAYGGIYLNVFDETSRVTLNPFNGAGTIKTYDFDTAVGRRLDVSTEFDLNVGAFAGKDGNNPQFSPFYPEVQGAIDASHTTKLFVDAPGDVTYASDSSHGYALVLHPPALAPSVAAASGTTTIPSGTGTFSNFGGHASLSGSNLAFYGTGSGGQSGVYLRTNGSPAKLADSSTAIPNGTGNFTGFGLGAIPGDPCVNGDSVAFFGAGSGGQQGLYRVVPAASPIKVADLNSAIPGGVGNFTAFSIGGIPTDPCVNGDTVAFFGAGSAGQQGIYQQSASDSPTKVADLNSAIPGGTGNFTTFVANAIPTDPCVSGDTVTFFGAGSSGQQGIYRAASNGSPIKLADVATAVPSSTGNFTSFGAFSVDPADASNIALVASSATVKGVYAAVGGGPLARIVDSTMTLPGSVSTFADFGAVAIDPANVAFLAIGSAGEKGIYADVDGTLVDVVNVEDTIDGRLIADLDFGGFGFTEVNGNKLLAYRASFSDGSAGIFTAAIAAPALSGDYNHDHLVDAADYTVWRDSLGQMGDNLAADSNGDHKIDQVDYDAWKSNFGAVASTGAAADDASPSSVPESESLIILAAGIFGEGSMLMSRRR
jgi:hypothetical protein